MKISAVQSCNNRNISFKHYMKCHRDSNGNFEYCTETWLLRDDLDWENLVNLINIKYKDADKVNLVNHACSAGYESYSLIMQLIKTLGLNRKKFLPIIARDRDYDAVEYAKSGRLDLCYLEISDARDAFGDIFTNSFDIERLDDTGLNYLENSCVGVCRSNLKKNVKFKQSNIFSDEKLINKDNTVLLFRNVWPYLGEDKVSELAYFLARNMKDSSLLVIGRYDCSYGIDKLLESYGFKKTAVKYVYEAPGKPAKRDIEKFPLEKRF